MRSCQLLLLITLSMPAWAAGDDYKVIKLEQDVRNLERQVGELNRQIAVLQRHDTPAPLARSDDSVAPGSDQWVNAARWEQVRIGMNELQVIELLGKPSALRAGDAIGQRTLLYAMEIGSSGFLGGSIELLDRRVTAIHKPILK